MTKVTYLDNFGYMVRYNDVLMVFDLFRDPAHALEKELRANPELKVVFFISDKSVNHFNRDIFNMAQNHHRVYVASNDVYGIADTEEPVAGMSAGDKIENVAGSLTVRAYCAGNGAVAFLVTTADGCNIFYGGELAPYVYGRKAHCTRCEQSMQSVYTTTVRRVAQDVQTVDLAFIDVDPEAGVGFTESAVEFVNTVHTDNLFPIHFGNSHSEAIDFRNYEVPAGITTRFHAIANPGHSLELNLAKTPA